MPSVASRSRVRRHARPPSGRDRRVPPALLLALAVVLTAARPLSSAAQEPASDVARTTLAFGVHHLTVRQPNPRNVINVVIVEADAPVEFKAVMRPSGNGRAVPQTVSELCRRWDCLVAVNGDMFGGGGRPLGAVITDGQVLVPMPASPVPAHWQLAVGPDGRFSVAVTPPGGARQSTGSSYPLLLDGQVQRIDERTSFTLNRHPRTFIGWNPAGQRIIATVDGRSSRSRGMTLAEGAALMQALGATHAVNMDGGGSATFVVNGRVVNRPSDGRERRIANAWLVVPRPAPAEPEAAEELVVVATHGERSPQPLVLAAGPPAPAPRPFWAALALLLMIGVLHAHYYHRRAS